MKKTLYLLLAAAILTGCSNSNTGLHLKVTGKQAIWGNGTIEFRTDMDSKGKRDDNPAFEAYVKYEDGKTIHMPIDGYSTGYGASFPMGNHGFYMPFQGLAKAEVLSRSDEKLVMHLHYDPWTIFGEPITLDKQITLYRDSPVMSVIDYYEGMFELLNIAAGLTTAFTGTVNEIENGFVIEYPYGITAVIVMPQAQQRDTDDFLGYAVLKKGVSSGEPLRYYVGISDKGADYIIEEIAKIL